MIQSFSVGNFASIKDKVTLSFEATNDEKLEDYYIIKPNEKTRLLKMGMIYGANASGKSNVLCALDFLRDLVLDPLDKKNEELDYNPFMFCEDWRDSNSEFELIFFANEIKYQYNLVFNQKGILKEKLLFFNPNKAIVFERYTDVEHKLSRVSFGGKVKISKIQSDTIEANTLWNNTVLAGYLKTNFSSHELDYVIRWFQQKFMPVLYPHQDLEGFTVSELKRNIISKELVLDVLKKADLNISNFIIEKKSEPIYFGKDENSGLKRVENIEIDEIIFNHNIEDKNYRLPYDLQSLGTQRYFQLSGVLALLINNLAILPIDEIESSLHPDLLRHFILLFLQNSRESQLICTTHFREFLQEKDLFRNDAIWFTEKNDKGATELFSLADFKSDVIRDTSSVFNAYKIGKLGAVPNLSNTYIDRYGEEE